MGKDFISWHREKQYIDNTITTKYPKERQIWNVKLGVNIGDEENGKNGFIRPVLVIKRIGSLYL